MILYLTTDSRRIIKENYNDLYKKTDIIVLSDILDRLNHNGLDKNPTLNFLLFLDLKKIFLKIYQQEIETKVIKNVVYLLLNLDEYNINEIKNFLNSEDIILHNFCLIDYHDDIDHSLYNLFDKVI